MDIIPFALFHTDRCFRWSSSLRWSNQSIFPLVALKLLEKDFCCWLEMWSATRLKNILQAISGPRGEQFPIGCFSKSIIPYGIRAMWKPCSSRSWRCRNFFSPKGRCLQEFSNNCNRNLPFLKPSFNIWQKDCWGSRRMLNGLLSGFGLIYGWQYTT